MSSSKHIARRRFIRNAAVTLAAAIATDAFAVEPKWIRETFHDFRHLGLGKRLIQFTDLHYKGDSRFFLNLIGQINALQPDLIVFTGDMVENKLIEPYLADALELMQKLSAPVFGILGNHDPDDAHSIAVQREAYAATGGRFLINERTEIDQLALHGIDGLRTLSAQETGPTILLCHYPMVAEAPRKRPYDLILAGHSHGGQIRLPFIGPLTLPSGVGPYVRGHFKTPIGPLYVNVGVGTFLIPARFLCRPEIAIFDL